MLTSLGVDIIEIDRIRQALRRRPQMASRLFTARERAYCDKYADPAPHYAARFAAKEATAKALGRWLRWQEVEVVSDDEGRPALSLSGEAKLILSANLLLLSLSHSRDYAVAVVAAVTSQENQPPSENLPGGGVWV